VICNSIQSCCHLPTTLQINQQHHAPLKVIRSEYYDCFRSREKSTDQPISISTITTGEIGRFASIDRSQKHITKGLELYRIPEELETVLRVLIQVLGAITDR
jgi:hypothetical protein